MIWRKYYKKIYYKNTYYKNIDWVCPPLTSDNTVTADGTIKTSASSYYAGALPYMALDGNKTGTTTQGGVWFTNNIVLGWWKVKFPYRLLISSIVHLNKAYTGQQNIIGRYYADVEKTKPFGPQISTTATSWTQYPITPEIPILTDTIYFDKTGGNVYGGIGELEITATRLVAGTPEDYTSIVQVAGTAEDNDGYNSIETGSDEYDYYVDTAVPETSNFIAGRYVCGRYIFAQNINKYGGGGGDTPDDSVSWQAGAFTIIAYNADGTKTAIYGAGSEKNVLTSVKFEIIETGCGSAEIVFNSLPTNAELDYKQRFDIHLYNDYRPWYSGYVLTRPIAGTTETTFKFTAHGYYNQLESLFLFETYENMEVADIVREIAKKAEIQIKTVYNAQKIINTGYKITKIAFDGVNIKDALKQLLSFAGDYVTGIDERRNIYFKPRITEIQEKARLWVGKHIATYAPSWDIEKLVNWARIKGGAIDTNGDSWLATVEDVDSQNLYGLQQDILTLPTAYSAGDAIRWGQNQIDALKNPIKSAKITGLQLEYFKSDGRFFVRKLSTDGMAAITTQENTVLTYPITKLKYTITSAGGIAAELELGAQPFKIDAYFLDLERNYKNSQLLITASNKYFS